MATQRRKYKWSLGKHTFKPPARHWPSNTITRKIKTRKKR